MQAVTKWKNLGKILCRLLRMSDYWYGFASDGSALSSEERATRRISVLHQVHERVGTFFFYFAFLLSNAKNSDLGEADGGGAPIEWQGGWMVFSEFGLETGTEKIWRFLPRDQARVGWDDV